MPRVLRMLIDGGYYHVLTRGNDRKEIFKCHQDYRVFLNVAKKYLTKYQVSIIHYCLMPNHVHLLMQAQKAKDLPKFMQGVLQVYASYFKKVHNAVGFVFQNRYKSHFIDNQAYLLECGRYIERNPLRAGLITDLLEYPWSSFVAYIRSLDDGIIIKKNPLYFELSRIEKERTMKYYNYVLQGRPYEAILDTVFKI